MSGTRWERWAAGDRSGTWFEVSHDDAVALGWHRKPDRRRTVRPNHTRRSRHRRAR